MDQSEHKSVPHNDIGMVVVFLIVLVAALLMRVYDGSGWAPAPMRADMVVAPVPPL